MVENADNQIVQENLAVDNNGIGDLNPAGLDADSSDEEADVIMPIVKDERLNNKKPKKKVRVRNTKMRITVLVLLFLEKFVEIMAVFLLTLLAIMWAPLYMLLQDSGWPLITLAIFLVTAVIVLYRVRWFRRPPGCFVYKLIYLHALTTIFFILAIHVPRDPTFLSPYFALLAAGIIGATYLLFVFMSASQKHLCKVDARGCTLWLYGFVMPVFVLVASQPVYFLFGIGDTVNYTDYIINVIAGIATSLPFIYETLFIYHRFVNSKDLKEFVHTRGILPGFVIAIFGKQVDMEDENGEKRHQFCEFRI